MFTIAAILFGSLVGSFLNVCIARLPKGESIAFPGSHCPHCGHPIRFYDNIPILSYLHLKGRCRDCGRPISVQYPVVEAVTALGSLWMFLRYGITLSYLFYFSFFSAMVVITVIDLYHQIIPDAISLPGIGVGLVSSLVLPEITLKDSVIGVLLGGGSLFVVATGYQWLFKREGMGGGDVKLLAMIGAFLGWKAVILTILMGSLLGSVVGIAVMLIQGKNMKYAIPFGPFLAAGALVSLAYGRQIMVWYLTGLG